MIQWVLTSYDSTFSHIDEDINAFHAYIDRSRSVGRTITKATRETESSRAILEAAATSERQLQAVYQQETHHLRAGTTYLVKTEQPLGAIAVYLCEACSDDNLVTSGIIPEPLLGAAFPVWRVIETNKAI